MLNNSFRANKLEFPSQCINNLIISSAKFNYKIVGSEANSAPSVPPKRRLFYKNSLTLTNKLTVPCKFNLQNAFSKFFE